MIDPTYVREDLRHRESEELVDILVTRDADEWQPEVFPIVEDILRERGVRVDEAVEARRPRARPPQDGVPSEPAPQGDVVLERFDGDIEAKLCQMSLGQAGIEAKLRQDAFGVSELLVDAAHVAAARAVLAAAEGATTEAEGFECRSCGFAAEPLREGSRLVCQVCGEES